MRQSKARAGAENPLMDRFIKPVGISCAVGIVATVILLMVLAAVMSFSDIPHSFIDPMAVAAACAGSFLAGRICAKMVREKGLLVGLLCGAVIFLISAISALMMGTMKFGPLLFIKFAAIEIAAAIGGILGVNSKSRRK